MEHNKPAVEFITISRISEVPDNGHGVLAASRIYGETDKQSLIKLAIQHGSPAVYVMQITTRSGSYNTYYIPLGLA